MLGLAQIAPLIAAVFMANELRKTRSLTAQRGFGIWLLFLLWVAVGVFVLQVDAPQAIPGGSTSRYLTFGFRFAWYLAATITLLYVYNLRSHISLTRVLRAFGWLFVTVTAGGILGAIRPTLDFPSAIEFVLPPRIRHIQFVHDTVHPVVAQLYTVDGVLNPRTSAPFAYTNQWGLNIACLLPFFVAGWLARDAGWRRRVAPLILIAWAYAVIHSQNRGLWLALGVMVAVLAVRAVILKQYRIFASIFVAAVIGAGIILATPLGSPVLDRLDTASSNSGRASLGQITVESVFEGSPIVGFGSTRNLEGSFYSIAGGNTADCSLCTPPALGTQGQFWLVIYSAGIGGVLLYLLFLLGNVLRGIRLRSPLATTGVLVITAHLATLLVYDSISMAEVSVFAGIALIWRAADAERPRGGGRTDPTLRGYSRFLRANAGVLVLCILAGAVAGIVTREFRGLKATATSTVFVQQTAYAAGAAKRAQTLDTVARYARSPQVLTDLSRILGRPVGPADRALSVTATPNTRLLQIHVTDRIPGIAIAGANSAAADLVASRTRVLKTQQRELIAALQSQQKATLSAISSLDARTRGNAALRARAEKARDALLTRLDVLAGKIAKAREARVTGGAIVLGSPSYVDQSLWLESVCSGVLLGLVAGLVIAMWRHVRTAHVGRRATKETIAGLPLLLRIGRPSRTDSHAATTTTGDAAADRPERPAEKFAGTTVLAVGEDPDISATASELDAAAGRCTSDPHEVTLVAGPRTRIRDIDRLHISLETAAARVRGVILIGQQTDYESVVISRADLGLSSTGQR